MTRKDLFKGLLGQHPADTPAPAPARRGAIGAVSQAIADLKARAVVEIDPRLIDAGGLEDRLEADPADDRTLHDSIAAHGQQVPVLVRPHPEDPGRYQIVYGRRRVRALQALQQPVKALIRALDDQELILAQGQENTVRRNLSFIEKANFARQMEEQGFDRKIICDALSIDKTTASRMLSITQAVPAALIGAIGAAPGIGRDRWQALANLMAKDRIYPDHLHRDEPSEERLVRCAQGPDLSDDRFQAVWNALSDRVAEAQHAQMIRETRRLHSMDGLYLGEMRCTAKHAVFKLELGQTNGFEQWLGDMLPGLFADWQAQREAPPQPEKP